jgi:predicted small lipoprotein YifL
MSGLSRGKFGAFLTHTKTVIAGLVPAIQDHRDAWVFMGGRDKPGHDDGWFRILKKRTALMLVFTLALGVASCGVKNDLVMPDGKPTPKNEKDPSKPPQQQER